MKNFSTVDLVEQDGGFIEEAKRNLASTNHRGQFFHIGMNVSSYLCKHSFMEGNHSTLRIFIIE